MLGGFVLGDHITRVMEGLIVQVLVSGVVKGDVRGSCTDYITMHIPDSCPARHSRDDKLSYTSPRHNLSRVRGRETKGRGGRYEETAKANVPSVERRQRNVYEGDSGPGREADMPI
jgi:hypothetical protein